MTKTAEKRYVMTNTERNVVIEVRGFQSEDNIIIATVKVTTLTGANTETYHPFKVGHSVTDTSFSTFASTYGYDLVSSLTGTAGTTYAAKKVTFTVKVDTTAIEGAEIIFNKLSKTTNASGVAVFNNTPEGASQPYSVTADLYDDKTGTVTVDGDEAVAVAMTLTE